MDEQLTFRIPRALARALASAARARGVPRSQLIREALTQYLPEQTPGARAKAGAVWERVRHYVGSQPLDRAAIEADELAARLRRHNWRE